MFFNMVGSFALNLLPSTVSALHLCLDAVNQFVGVAKRTVKSSQQPLQDFL